MVGEKQFVLLLPCLLASVQAWSCDTSCDLFPKVASFFHTDKCYCFPGSLCGNTGSEPELLDCPSGLDFSLFFASGLEYSYTNDTKGGGYHGFDLCSYDHYPTGSMPKDKVTPLCQVRFDINGTCEGTGAGASCHVGLSTKYSNNFAFFGTVAWSPAQTETLHIWAVIDADAGHFGAVRTTWGNTSSDPVAPSQAYSPQEPLKSRSGCTQAPCGSSEIVV